MSDLYLLPEEIELYWSTRGRPPPHSGRGFLASSVVVQLSGVPPGSEAAARFS